MGFGGRAPGVIATAGLAAALTALVASPALAKDKMYSYDAVSPNARALTGVGLTFEFRPTLMGATRVDRFMLTGRSGAAEVKPASEGALGKGGLAALIGPDAKERALYQITLKRDGDAFIRAACPNSTKAWLVLGPIRYGEDLRVHAIGDDPVTGKSRLCGTFEFSFRGEWKLPELPVRAEDDEPRTPL